MQVQEPQRVAQLRPGNVVVRIDPDGSVVDTIYASQLWSSRDLTISPSGDLLGLIEITEGVVRDGEYVVWPRSRLTVFDWEGAVRQVLDAEVHRYIWCCRLDTIIAILGPYREEGVGFRYESVVIFDVRTGQRTPINLPEPVKALAWADFDLSVYFLPIRSPQRAIRFDPTTSNVSRTDYRGISFSPSGRYYLYHQLGATGEEPGWHLVERESGREMAPPDPSLGTVAGWVFEEGDALLLARSEADVQRRGLLSVISSRVTGYTIYDVDRRVVSRTVEGEELQNSVAEGGGFTYRRDGDVAVIRRVSP